MKLSSAQKSALKQLRLNDGFSRLYGGMLRTYGVLHDKGLVVVTIETPVNGNVALTKIGAAKADEYLGVDDNYERCGECKAWSHKHEAACIHCAAAKPWANE